MSQEKMIRVSFVCRCCGVRNKAVLPRSDAVIFAGELLKLDRTDLIMLEDEASALEDELDEVDAVVESPFLRPMTTLPGFNFPNPPWNPNRYRKD